MKKVQDVYFEKRGKDQDSLEDFVRSTDRQNSKKISFTSVGPFDGSSNTKLQNLLLTFGKHSLIYKQHLPSNIEAQQKISKCIPYPARESIQRYIDVCKVCTVTNVWLKGSFDIPTFRRIIARKDPGQVTRAPPPLDCSLFKREDGACKRE